LFDGSEKWKMLKLLKDANNEPQFYQPVLSDYLVVCQVILFILMSKTAQYRYQNYCNVS
jgi:hypothetical protein